MLTDTQGYKITYGYKYFIGILFINNKHPGPLKYTPVK